MYMKRKVLIHRFKKYKNLNFHKSGLGLFKIGVYLAFFKLEVKWTWASSKLRVQNISIKRTSKIGLLVINEF